MINFNSTVFSSIFQFLLNKFFLFRYDSKRRPFQEYATFRPQPNKETNCTAAICLDASDGVNIQGFFRVALDGTENLRTKLNLDSLFNVSMFGDFNLELSVHPTELSFQEFNLLNVCILTYLPNY